MTAGKLVQLRNGSEVHAAAAAAVMVNLRQLADADPIATYELVMACRDRDHVLFGNTGSKLRERGLIESADDQGRARVHDVIRDIVVSAAEGDGLGITIGNPAATP